MCLVESQFEALPDVDVLDRRRVKRPSCSCTVSGTRSCERVTAFVCVLACARFILRKLVLAHVEAGVTFSTSLDPSSTFQTLPPAIGFFFRAW